MRDLLLILLGVALTKGDRTRVLDKLTRGLLDAEFNTLLNAIRDRKPRSLVTWLSEHGVEVGKGEDVIDVLISEVHSRAVRDQIRREMRALEFSRTEDVDLLTERVRTLLKTLEGVTDGRVSKRHAKANEGRGKVLPSTNEGA